MKHFFAAIIVLLFFATACGKQQHVRAKVFERRELKENRLSIRYQYKVDEKLYIDSATVANVVIKTDSIYVIIDPSNPGKSIPDIVK